MAASKPKKVQFPDYKHVRTWIEWFGHGQMPDQRAVHEFMDIEQREVIASLRVELFALSQGRFDVKIMDQVLRPKRKMKHGSYEQWAKYMLIWMAEHKG